MGAYALLTPIGGVPGSHYAKFIDVLHHEHAVVEDGMRQHGPGHAALPAVAPAHHAR